MRSQLAEPIVDTTVQLKAITHTTDSRLLVTARQKLVEAAKAVGVRFKQTHAGEGVWLDRQAGRYVHARQFKRQRIIVGRQARHVQRQINTVVSLHASLMSLA